MKSRKTIVVFGGPSSERLVSTATAQNILNTLPGSATRAWHLGKDLAVYECSRDAVLGHANPFKEEFRAAGAPKFASIEKALESGELAGQVLVLALHGQGVEDGAIQSKLEKAGVAFTGSSAKSSALAFDKIASKKVARAHGVRIARDMEITSQTSEAVAQTLVAAIRQYERIAVKPVADGSSLGLQILYGRSDIGAAAAEIARDGRRFLIEEFISGTELTVGVVDNGRDDPYALPPSEVKLDTGANFNYDAKYLGKGVEELTPARVAPEVTKAAQKLALEMHVALGCEGYSRTDMIVTRDGPVYLETNTLPGMTRASFFPQQLAVAKSSVQEFIAAEIERALAAGFCLAVINGNLRAVQAMLADEPALANCRGAVHPDDREQMMKQGADRGWTPLHLAAHYGKAEVVEALIAAGARIDAKALNRIANTPIMAAEAGGQPAISRILKAAQATRS